MTCTALSNNIRQVAPPKNTIIVSDKWKGTVAAVKQYRTERCFTEAQLPHEIVNHSAGEIINQRGFTTNLIEAKWSVLKRWLRRVNGGRMPTHSDRKAWTRLLTLFQFRKLLKSTDVTFMQAVAECF